MFSFCALYTNIYIYIYIIVCARLCVILCIVCVYPPLCVYIMCINFDVSITKCTKLLNKKAYTKVSMRTWKYIIDANITMLCTRCEDWCMLHAHIQVFHSWQHRYTGMMCRHTVVSLCFVQMLDTCTDSLHTHHHTHMNTCIHLPECIQANILCYSSW